ncbi:MAG: 1,4-dihydroxy-2-naphthoate polyprenyltransferase [Bacteroidetes bacterium]|nr:1,4-dihydroxy-2-naphthoate polyprenyltransferase [Bacteroidota bacterium]MBU1115854.1 1,4-dihydroxy-2-naphthoate polyprenyltransferase [Bacteroidota bacterium]MBU1797968.1 1,4-dihydroxy-2-naphthoate polyprenyltransferase [Bacteroidota bacterium]
MNNQTKINKLNIWILASRPKTLPAAIAPVFVGTAVAFNADKLNLWAAIIALICSLLIQIGTNFVNDLYDFLKGTDDENRVGPTRALAAGWISTTQMKFAIYLTFGITFLLGLFLVYHAGWIILLIGILSIISGYAYTAGPYPLAYNGLGDIFVFTFFGLVATVGTYYVQALQFSLFALLTSIPIGFLITNILVVNNYRDAEEDKKKNKKTLAVILGKSFARYQYLVSLFISYLIPIVLLAIFKTSPFILLPLLTLPLAIKLQNELNTFNGARLNNTLSLSAKLSVLFSALFSLGIIL